MLSRELKRGVPLWDTLYRETSLQGYATITGEAKGNMQRRAGFYYTGVPLSDRVGPVSIGEPMTLKSLEEIMSTEYLYSDLMKKNFGIFQVILK